MGGCVDRLRSRTQCLSAYALSPDRDAWCACVLGTSYAIANPMLGGCGAALRVPTCCVYDYRYRGRHGAWGLRVNMNIPNRVRSPSLACRLSAPAERRRYFCNGGTALLMLYCIRHVHSVRVAVGKDQPVNPRHNNSSNNPTSYTSRPSGVALCEFNGPV